MSDEGTTDRWFGLTARQFRKTLTSDGQNEVFSLSVWLGGWLGGGARGAGYAPVRLSRAVPPFVPLGLMVLVRGCWQGAEPLPATEECVFRASPG